MGMFLLGWRNRTLRGVGLGVVIWGYEKMKIEKKVKEKYFKEVVDGKKRFEVRLADFDCEPGDTIVLKEQVGKMMF